MGYFNPRSHKGSDYQRSIKKIGITRFQSTLPQGERRLLCLFAYLILQFQSTLPQGERLPYRTFNELKQPISIHAPTRGATSAFPEIAPHGLYFNPRSHKGSDGYLIPLERRNGNFNPRSHKGSDRRWACSGKR